MLKKSQNYEKTYNDGKLTENVAKKVNKRNKPFIKVS